VLLCIPVASFIGAVAGWVVVFPLALLFHGVKAVVFGGPARGRHIHHA
jgi:hypothetical protein